MAVSKQRICSNSESLQHLALAIITLSQLRKWLLMDVQVTALTALMVALRSFALHVTAQLQAASRLSNQTFAE